MNPATAPRPENAGELAVWVIAGYLLLLILVGAASNLRLRKTSGDYFLASRAIGPFALMMTLFGTTMTSFAIIGSSGEAFRSGVGVYGKMVSWSGLIHSLCFFLVGVRLWSYGKRFGHETQIQFFRDRFEADKLGLLLFPCLVGLVIPYVLMGIIGGGNAIENVTRGAFDPSAEFAGVRYATETGGVPYWLGSLVICLVVLSYVFFGGVRGATWANVFQTSVFVVLGIVAFWVISDRLGGLSAATANVVKYNPAHLMVEATPEAHAVYEQRLAEFAAGQSPIKPREPAYIPPLVFMSYIFIPLSVAMFPHLFQHWLTARSAASFKLSLFMHPFMMMLTWVPCVLIGIWATSAIVDGRAVIPPDFANQNAVLPLMVQKLAPTVLGGLLVAGVLAAIMSSLDSQFICVGSIFTNDIVKHYMRRDRMSDRAELMTGRLFIVLIVVIAYTTALFARQWSVFRLGVWCFTGFAALSPLVFGALYWRRCTKAGAYACVLTAAALWVWFFSQARTASGEDAFLVFGMMPVATITVAAALALVVVSLITPPPSGATIARFFPDRPPALGARAARARAGAA